MVTRHRHRVQVKLHDKVAAPNALAKHLGMFTERRVVEGTIEYRVAQMTQAERLERVRQLREKARQNLPAFESVHADGEPVPQPIIGGTEPQARMDAFGVTAAYTAAANDDDVLAWTPSASLGQP